MKNDGQMARFSLTSLFVVLACLVPFASVVLYDVVQNGWWATSDPYRNMPSNLQSCKMNVALQC
jgi:hypothetical protein